MPKALPLSHRGIRLDGDKSAKGFPISKMLLLNIRHELTYDYNRCQNARIAIFYKLIVEIKKKTCKPFVIRYVYVKMASKWSQN